MVKIKESTNKKSDNKSSFGIKFLLVGIFLIFGIIYSVSINSDEKEAIPSEENMSKAIILNEDSVEDRILELVNEELIEDRILELVNEELIEDRILELVNEEREIQNVKSISRNDKFYVIAKKHSVRMLEENFLGYSNNNVRENIAVISISNDFESCGETKTNEQIADCIYKKWKENEIFHSNIINKRYVLTGIGIACNRSECKITQTFG